MTELIPTIVIALVLGAIIEKTSKFQRISALNIRVCIIALFIVLTLFIGLRTRYNDTTTYTHSYNMLMKADNPFNEIDWVLGTNPGFHFVNAVLMRCGWSAQSFLLFYAAITIGIYLWFLKKYANNFLFSLFLFITVGCYTFTLAAIKQCVAMALCLVATDRAIQKKPVSFAFFIILASLFHPYALMYLIVPFMTFCPWSGRSVVLFGFFAFLGVLLQRLLGTLISITTMLGEEYTVESFVGDGVNPFRLAVCAVPLMLALMSKRVIYSKNDKINNLFVNLSMLNAEIMFIALFGTANYFARLANYFLIFQTIALPWLVTHFDWNSQKVLKIGATLGYSVYFYYANVINQHFDSLYSSISFMKYLQSIL